MSLMVLIDEMCRERGLRDDTKQIFIEWIKEHCETCRDRTACSLTNIEKCSTKEKILKLWNEFIVDWKNDLLRGG